MTGELESLQGLEGETLSLAQAHEQFTDLILSGIDAQLADLRRLYQLLAALDTAERKAESTEGAAALAPEAAPPNPASRPQVMKQVSEAAREVVARCTKNATANPAELRRYHYALQRYGKALDKTLPGSELRPLPNSGQTNVLEQNRAVAALIRAHLEAAGRLDLARVLDTEMADLWGGAGGAPAAGMAGTHAGTGGSGGGHRRLAPAPGAEDVADGVPVSFADTAAHVATALLRHRDVRPALRLLVEYEHPLTPELATVGFQLLNIVFLMGYLTGADILYMIDFSRVFLSPFAGPLRQIPNPEPLFLAAEAAGVSWVFAIQAWGAARLERRMDGCTSSEMLPAHGDPHRDSEDAEDESVRVHAREALCRMAVCMMYCSTGQPEERTRRLLQSRYAPHFGLDAGFCAAVADARVEPTPRANATGGTSTAEDSLSSSELAPLPAGAKSTSGCCSICAAQPCEAACWGRALHPSVWAGVGQALSGLLVPRTTPALNDTLSTLVLAGVVALPTMEKAARIQGASADLVSSLTRHTAAAAGSGREGDGLAAGPGAAAGLGFDGALFRNGVPVDLARLGPGTRPADAERLWSQTQQAQRWAAQVQEIPVPIPLEEGMDFHSVFICPVSKSRTSPFNWPMRLSCGHAVSETTLRNLATKNYPARFTTTTGSLKCPYCPKVTPQNQAEVIYF
ncbi:hypothetical protein H696_04879 [Fonticula alba]|uniref:RING-Gid-type domain-containing protein n=1 Tax=Fonticula alba TaxID=691883 RepID=A0A058Z4Z9_FONAL|nr:hypothetical protein H696_04879 [Fonticula alba]KCV68587.1 hypothetical protein H696_04879 [Fonticula alba]|eukprot:XP_009497019.1 hypothetical protein H696_04879 [Fonticula alba]